MGKVEMLCKARLDYRHGFMIARHGGYLADMDRGYGLRLMDDALDCIWRLTQAGKDGE